MPRDLYQEIRILKGNVICRETIRSSNTVELLGVTLNKNINSKSHIENICCKVNIKIRELFQIRNFLSLEQAKVFCSCNILSNIRYCPTICGCSVVNAVLT